MSGHPLQEKALSLFGERHAHGLCGADRWRMSPATADAIAAALGVRTIDGQDPDRPEVVVLCGSTRFKEAFWQEGTRLSRGGAIVLGVADLDPRPEARNVNVPIDDETKALLDRVHLHQIDMADRVHVINVDGYIGESTQREIAYATSRGKPITYLFRPTCEEEG